MVYGDGGAGKTTLAIDLALPPRRRRRLARHPRRRSRVRVLLIENEGPRPLFRRKLDRKRRRLAGLPLGDRLHVCRGAVGRSSPSPTRLAAGARRARPRARDRRRDRRAAHRGRDGRGRDAAGGARVRRATSRTCAGSRRRRVAFVLVHHENKGGKVSGAWEGVGDTLLHVQAQGHGARGSTVQKARWASQSARHHAESPVGRGRELRRRGRARARRRDARGADRRGDRERSGSGWTRIEKATPGVARDRRRAVRDGLFAARRIINVVKQGGEQAVLDRCPEKVAAHLYVADDPAVAHLRLERGAAAAQPAPTRGEPGDLQLRRAPRPKSGAEAQAQPYPPSTNDEEAQLDTAWWEQS